MLRTSYWTVDAGASCGCHGLSSCFSWCLSRSRQLPPPSRVAKVRSDSPAMMRSRYVVDIEEEPFTDSRQQFPRFRSQERVKMHNDEPPRLHHFSSIPEYDLVKDLPHHDDTPASSRSWYSPVRHWLKDTRHPRTALPRPQSESRHRLRPESNHNNHRVLSCIYLRSA